MDIAQALARNIKAARCAAGMSQAELAKALGLASHSAVAAIEGGKRRVSALELCALSHALGKSVDWLLHPEASREDFVLLARAQDPTAKTQEALRQAERLVENFLLLKRLLGVKQ